MDRMMTSAAASTMPKSMDYDKLKQILEKVRDLKQSLSNFLIEYEQGQLNWPTILDQMNLLSSQVKTLRQGARHIYPLLRSNTIIPMCLSPDVDPNVERLTEQRLSMFNHHTVPELLRTKNLPEIEERERVLGSTPLGLTLNGRAVNLNEIHQFAQEFNSYLNFISESFQNTKEITDKSEKQFDHQRYTNVNDTKLLLDAVQNGNEFRMIEKPAPTTTSKEQNNLNPTMANPNQRSAGANVRIKTSSKQNR